ncbi:MAG: hypothetical protein Kapaf2KO_13370 [Candidatus Kapaibacteriales bacterium]
MDTLQILQRSKVFHNAFAEVGEVGNVLTFESPLLAGSENYWKIKGFGGGLSSAYSDEAVWAE